jgi:glycosyltransferase involved in cell wall biosynthesis
MAATATPGVSGQPSTVPSRQARSQPRVRPVRTDPVLSVLLPIYNEEATLDLLLDQLLALDLGFEFEVVAVNDASSDGTADILARRDDPRLRVINHHHNRGKGAAVRTAVESAKGVITVIQDADLEYHPGQLPALVAPVLAGETDVVYGSRFLGSVTQMRKRNRLANLGLTWLTRVLYSTTITDMETCYKVMRREVMTDLRVEAQRFDMEPEITARLIRRGHHILELPIVYEGRTHDDGKKIGYGDGVQAVWTLVRWRFRRNP